MTIDLTERERDLLLAALTHPLNTWMIELKWEEWRAIVVKLGGLPAVAGLPRSRQ